MANRTRPVAARVTAGLETGSYFVRDGVHYQPARLKQRTRELMAYVENPDRVLDKMVFLKDEPLPGDPSLERREELGTGPDGERYYSVTFDGKNGVMKDCRDIAKDRGAFSLLVKEVCMFNVLQDLQGKAVSRLLGFGFASARGFFLVRAYEGLKISPPITYAVLDSAERSLLSIHKKGWLLGDIQPANFALRNERVTVTCLMHCEPLADYNRMEKATELHSLRLMLSWSQGTVHGKEDVRKIEGEVKGDRETQAQASTAQTSVNISEECSRTMGDIPSDRSPMTERASNCSISGDINEPVQTSAPC